jgi:hypothetical protein
VIIATLGMATVLRASPFPEWQDDREHHPFQRARTTAIEEHP